MTKGFSIREKVLLGALILILVGALYYSFVWQPTSRTITEAAERIGELDEDILVEQTKADEIKKMQEALADVSVTADTSTVTPQYDNSVNLINSLNPILAGTSNLRLSFDTPSVANGIATRSMQFNFNTATYQQARDIINEISRGIYSNDITSMRMTISGFGDSEPNVGIALTVNYYEVYN